MESIPVTSDENAYLEQSLSLPEVRLSIADFFEAF
jgi:hypothetical protein